MSNNTSKNKSHIIHDALLLLAITLISALVLSFVNQVTAEPIAKAQSERQEAAYREVFPDAASFVPDADFSPDEASEKLTGMGYKGLVIGEICSAGDENGANIGYVLNITTPDGYNGDIKIAVGIDSATMKLTAISVLEHSETPTLGGKCAEADFTGMFHGADIVGIEALDGITNATYTSNAIFDAAEASLAYVSEHYGKADINK